MLMAVCVCVCVCKKYNRAEIAEVQEELNSKINKSSKWFQGTEAPFTFLTVIHFRFRFYISVILWALEMKLHRDENWTRLNHILCSIAFGFMWCRNRLNTSGNSTQFLQTPNTPFIFSVNANANVNKRPNERMNWMSKRVSEF